MQQKKVIVYSHTHWDREWYRTFQQFRFSLVSTIDQILNLLQAGEYEFFVLDGQTIVIEDYLEIETELKPTLAKWIRKGKLIVGPWYVLPDEFLVSGESLIRNLLYGKHISDDFGNIQKIGYLPDMFGHISQMPQILKGFRIEKVVVWRGVNPNKSLFIWEGLDKSKVLTTHLSDGYYNTFIINYEKQKDDFTKHLKKLEENSYKDVILFPNGGDHLAPYPELRDVLHDMSVKNPGYKFIQGTIDDYFQLLKINKEELEVISGELRNPERAYILPGVFSTRIYLKQKNHKLQNLLSSWVEPLSSISWILGNDYNQGFIDLGWKTLLQNQPHDSICGCSTDEVHKEMLHRYEAGEQICEKLITATMKNIASSLNLDKRYYHIILFNTSNWLYSGVEEITLDFLKEDEIESFRLIDEKGQDVGYEIIEMKEMKKFVSEIDVLPEWIDIKRFKISLYAENINALGIKSIKIVPEGSYITNNEKLLLNSDDNNIENNFLSLNVSDGKIILKSLVNNDEYLINNFHSSGDAGDEYNFSPPENDFLSRAVIIKSELFYKNPLTATLKVTYHLEQCEKLEENRKTLSNRTVINEITSFITLNVNDPVVHFKTVINNVSKDHRIRVTFSSGLSDETEDLKCFYDTQFGILEKEVKVNNRSYDVEKYKERLEETFAIQSFAEIGTLKSGLALITKGIPETEIIQENDKYNLALTLIRSVGWLSKDDLRTRGGGAGPSLPTPDAQCSGINTFEYFLYPHSKLLLESDAFIKAHHSVSGIKALQFKPVEKTSLDLKDSLLKLEPDNLILSALKRSENQDGLIFRFYNPTPYSQIYYIKPSENFTFSEIDRVRLDETKICVISRDKKGNFSGTIEPFEIVSLEFKTLNKF